MCSNDLHSELLCVWYNPKESIHCGKNPLKSNATGNIYSPPLFSVFSREWHYQPIPDVLFYRLMSFTRARSYVTIIWSGNNRPKSTELEPKQEPEKSGNTRFDILVAEARIPWRIIRDDSSRDLSRQGGSVERREKSAGVGIGKEENIPLILHPPPSLSHSHHPVSFSHQWSQLSINITPTIIATVLSTSSICLLDQCRSVLSSPSLAVASSLASGELWKQEEKLEAQILYGV